MKLALLGDIHGNALALEAVLNSAKDKNVSHYLITGDFVGYYYEPAIVLDMIAEIPATSVIGNHDQMFLACRHNEAVLKSYRKKYGSGMDFALDQLEDKHIDFIKKLPDTDRFSIASATILLAHGAPWDTNCYIYPDAKRNLWDKLDAAEVEFIVLGHTHYQFSKTLENTMVINPGSVGQPRDKKHGASWTLFDTETKLFTHHNEEYDIGKVIQMAKKYDKGFAYLQEVLIRQ